jgi:hypothetical protein
MPDVCVDGLSDLGKLANKTLEDYNAKHIEKLIKDIEKLSGSLKHNKEVCPFL